MITPHKSPLRTREKRLGMWFWLGMVMGRGKVEGWGFHLRPAWFYFTSSPPRSAWRWKLSHPIPAPWGLAKPQLPHPIKLYFLLICPATSIIFLMKSISLIKIYLKLWLNLSHQIKSIFRKNWIIYPIV